MTYLSHPVLSRSLEKYVVLNNIYPALRNPPPQLNFEFEDQFAFRPTGSTTAAIIAILHTVRSMLSTNEYVHVFAFDFSKAFDSVRHSTLISKLATMQLPGSTYTVGHKKRAPKLLSITLAIINRFR